MTSSRAHVLVLPKALFVLRVFQLATALAILGLAAYSITDWYTFDGIDLTLFSVRSPIDHVKVPSLTRSIGGCNHHHFNLCHRRRDWSTSDVQLLGHPWPRYLCYRLLDHIFLCPRRQSRYIQDCHLQQRRVYVLLLWILLKEAQSGGACYGRRRLYLSQLYGRCVRTWWTRIVCTHCISCSITLD
jgi:hypothetical protein